MLCILHQKSKRENVKYANLIDAVINHCNKKRIKISIINSFEEALEIHKTNPDMNLLIFGNTADWVFRIIYQSYKSNLKVICGGNKFIETYQSLFSSVSFDITNAMTTILDYINKCKRKNIAVYGIDTSLEEHISYAGTIVKFMPWLKCNGEQVFPIVTNLSDCWQNFESKLHFFDTVICPDDVIAVSLIKHIKSTNPSLLKKLHIISLYSSKIGNVSTPSLSSVYMDGEEFATAVIRAYTNNNRYGFSTHITVKQKLIPGDTTENISINTLPQLFPYSQISRDAVISFEKPKIQLQPDSEYNDVYRLNTLLTICSNYELSVLVTLMEVDSYNDIASRLDTVPETVKYYIRKLCSKSGFKNKSELIKLLRYYFTLSELKSYRNNIQIPSKIH